MTRRLQPRPLGLGGSTVMDCDRGHLVAGMAVHKSQEGREQFALILRRRGANLGSDPLGRVTVELKRTLELLVLPSGGALARAPDSHVGSTTAFPDCRLLGNERAVKARPSARNNLDDFHGNPLPRSNCGRNIQR